MLPVSESLLPPPAAVCPTVSSHIVTHDVLGVCDWGIAARCCGSQCGLYLSHTVLSIYRAVLSVHARPYGVAAVLPVMGRCCQHL